MARENKVQIELGEGTFSNANGMPESGCAFDLRKAHVENDRIKRLPKLSACTFGLSIFVLADLAARPWNILAVATVCEVRFRNVLEKSEDKPDKIKCISDLPKHEAGQKKILGSAEKKKAA